MKNRLRQLTSAALAFLLTLLLVAPVSYAEGDIEVSFSALTYTGTAQEPTVTVKKGGVILSSETYTVSFSDNVNAGEGTASITFLSGGTIQRQFTIQPKELTAADFSFAGVCTKEYDARSTAQPELIARTVGGDSVQVSYSEAYFDQNEKFVGSGRVVTVRGISISGPDAENYSLAQDIVVTGPGQIIESVLQLPSSVTAAPGETLDLRDYMTGAQDIVCQMVDAGNGSTVSGTTFTAGPNSGTVRIRVDVVARDVNDDGVSEYRGATEYLTITIRPNGTSQSGQQTPAEPEAPVTPPVKEDQAPVKISGPAAILYGQTARFTAAGGSGTGAVTWQVLSGDNIGGGTISAGGVFTPTHVGTVRIAAVKAGDASYLDRTADAVTLTIQPVPITIRAANKTALVGDPLPTLSDTDYTVTGLLGGHRLTRSPTLAYSSGANTAQPGTYAIIPSGAAVPNENYDSNIRYENGTLTVSAVPLYQVTVTPPANGSVTADRTAVEPDTTVTLTVKADEGYALKELTVTGPGGTVKTTEVGQGRYTFTMPDGDVTVSARFLPLAPVLPFTDVTEGDWFYDSVLWVYDQGLMKGTTDTCFSPEEPTTRGMIVTILHRLAGEPETPAWSPFGDVSPSQYYAGPIAWAAWNGIVTGATATAFEPESNITREQMAAILYRYESKNGSVNAVGDLSQFKDRNKISPYAQTPLAWAVGEGLLGGKGNGILDPRGPATRAEVAAILMRFAA